MPLPSIASATSIEVVGGLAYSITGTATIDTITGLKAGQAVTLVATGAFTFGTGGNIAASTTLTTAGRAYTLVFDGTTAREVGSSAGEVDSLKIGSNWLLQSETEDAVERLTVTAVGANDAAELFLHPTGSANTSRLTITDNANTTNYDGVAIEATTTANTIESVKAGTGTAQPIKLKIDGTEVMTVTSGAVDIIGTLTADSGLNGVYFPLVHEAAGFEFTASSATVSEIPQGFYPAVYVKMSALGTPTSARMIVQYDGTGLANTNLLGLAISSAPDAPGVTPISTVASSIISLNASSGNTATQNLTVSQLGSSDIWVQPFIYLDTAATGPVVYHMALALYY